MVHASERGETLRDHSRADQQARRSVEGVWQEPSQSGLLMAGSSVLARRVRSIPAPAVPALSKS